MRPDRRFWSLLGLLTLFVLPASLMSGSEPWVAKPYREWTEDDAIEVLSDSPWAQVWFTSRGSHSNTSGPPPVSKGTTGEEQASGQHDTCCRTYGSGVGAAAGDARNAPRPPGGPEPSVATQPGRPALSYRVLWISSMRVRQALYRLGRLRGEPAAPATEASLVQPSEQIVIALSGPSMQRFASSSLADLKSTTVLRSKKNKAKKVELMSFGSPAERQDRMAVFVFPRLQDGKPIFDQSDGEIEFSTGEGVERVHASFKLGKMTTPEGLDF